MKSAIVIGVMNPVEVVTDQLISSASNVTTIGMFTGASAMISVLLLPTFPTT